MPGPVLATRWVAGDLVRLAALASVVVGAATGGLEAALFLLVLGGAVIPRVLGVPVLLDVAYCAAILVAAWSSVRGLYEEVGWWDLAVHTVATGLVAAVAYLALTRLGLPAADRSTDPPTRAGAVVVVTALGALLSLVWELGEYVGVVVVDDGINVGYVDTLGDMGSGVVGSVLIALLLVRRRPTGR